MTSLGFRTGSFGTSAYFDELSADKLRFHVRLTIFEEHLDDFSKVRVEFVERLGLRMGTGKPGTKPTYNPVSGQRSTTAV